jgi:hypothetical protein
MKKILLSIISITIVHFSFAQQWTTSGSNIYNNNTGNVGIGTTSPSVPLTVEGGGTTGSLTNIGTTTTARFNTANPSIVLGLGYVSSDNPFLQAFNSVFNSANKLLLNPFGGNVGIGTISPGYSLHINRSTATLALDGITGSLGNSGAAIDLFGWATSNKNWQIGVANIGPDGFAITPSTVAGGSVFSTPALLINSSGNVGIGTTAPDALLSVAGTIHTKEVKIDLTGWSDYVFKKSYKLPSLLEVKTYIDKN